MQNFSSILKKTAVIIIILTITGYAYYRTKDFIIGPTISIQSPKDGGLVNLSLVEIYGTAKNISYISVNDRQIFTDEEGKFKEKLLLYPGYNIISIKARDRFERDIEKTLELVYVEETLVDNVKTRVLDIEPSRDKQDVEVKMKVDELLI